jgi:hypothetical protein
MAANPKGRKNNIPFIGIPFNVGCTTYYNPTHTASEEVSFGRPAFFFRFSFTSAIYSMPYAKVFWSEFVIDHCQGYYYPGHFTAQSWNADTLDNDDISVANGLCCHSMTTMMPLSSLKILTEWATTRMAMTPRIWAMTFCNTKTVSQSMRMIH